MRTSPVNFESPAAAPRGKAARRPGVIGAAILTALLMPAGVGAAAVSSTPTHGATGRLPALRQPVQRCTPVTPTLFARHGGLKPLRVSVPVRARCL